MQCPSPSRCSPFSHELCRGFRKCKERFLKPQAAKQRDQHDRRSANMILDEWRKTTRRKQWHTRQLLQIPGPSSSSHHRPPCRVWWGERAAGGGPASFTQLRPGDQVCLPPASSSELPEEGGRHFRLACPWLFLLESYQPPLFLLPQYPSTFVLERA